jgi:hypothetical protein
MKAATVKNNPRPLWNLSKEVAPGFLELSRRGKTVAYLLLASHYDLEDIGYMTDPEFWKLMAERAKGPFIPFDEVKAKIFRNPTRRRTSNDGRRKGKRNGTA